MPGPGAETTVGEVRLGPAFRGRTSPVVASNGEDFLVVWTDYRVGNILDAFPGSMGDIVAARLTARGELLDLAGIAVCFEPGNQDNASVTWDGTDYLVTWTDSRDRNTAPDVWGAHVTLLGQVKEPGGFPVIRASGRQSNATVRSTPSQIVAMTWTEAFDGGGLIKSGVFRQELGLVESTGVPGWATSSAVEPLLRCASEACAVMWPAPSGGALGYIFDTRAIGNSLSSRVFAADSGISVTSLDRAGPGSYAATYVQNATDVRLGFVDDQLGVGGAPKLVSNSGVVGWSRVSGHADGGIVLTMHNVATNLVHLRATSFSRAGTVDSGVTVATLRYPGAFDVASNGRSDLVAWETLNSSFAGTIQVRLVPFDELTETIDAGEIISGSGLMQALPRLATNGTDFALAWVEIDANNVADLLATRLDADGLALDPVPLHIAGSVSRTTAPLIAWAGDNYLVAWATIDGLKGRRISATGALLEEELSLSPDAGVGGFSLAAGGTDFMAVFADLRVDAGSPTTIGATWVTSTGTVTPVSLDLPPSVFARTGASANWVGDHFVVLWTEAGDIYGEDYDVARGPLSATTRYTLDGGRAAPVLHSNDQAAWLMWRSSTPDSGVDVSGTAWPLDETPTPSRGAVFAGARGTQNNPVMVSSGEQALLVFQSAQDPLAYDEVSVEGTVLSRNAEPLQSLVFASKYTSRSPTAACAGRHCLVAWEGFRGDPGVVSRRVTVRPLAFPKPCQSLSECEGTESCFQGTCVRRRHYKVGCACDGTNELWALAAGTLLFWLRRRSAIPTAS